MAAPRDWRDHLVRVVRCRLSIYASLSISMRLLSFFVSGFVVAFDPDSRSAQAFAEPLEWLERRRQAREANAGGSAEVHQGFS